MGMSVPLEMARANRSSRGEAAALRLSLAALALGVGILEPLALRAQTLPMQTQPRTRRQFIQEPLLQPPPDGSRTIQRLDDLLQQQQRQGIPGDTLRNLNELEPQQK